MRKKGNAQFGANGLQILKSAIKTTGVGCHFLLQGTSQPTSPELAGRVFTTEPLGKQTVRIRSVYTWA